MRNGLKPFLLAVITASPLCSCRTADANGAKLADAGGASATSADETPLPDYAPQFVKVGVDRDHESAKAEEVAPANGLALANSPQSGARYFFTVYGYQAQGPFNLPRFTHTWAYFVRALGTDLYTAPLEAFTISWDAADGQIGIAQPVKAGHNYTLEETFALANNQNANVAVQRSAIYEVNAAFFNKAYARYAYFVNGEANGQVRYKMMDDYNGRTSLVQGASGGYSNCTHATADFLSAGGQLVNTGTARGFAASDMVVQWYLSSPYVIQSGQDVNGALAPRLGI